MSYIYNRRYATAVTAGGAAGSTHIDIPLIKRSVVDFAVTADWTPVAGDVRVLLDTTAAANIATLPTFVSTGGTGGAGVWRFVFSPGEMTCRMCTVIISDAAAKAIEDDGFTIETAGNAAAQYPADLWQATPSVNVSTINSQTANASGTITFPAATLASTTNISGGTIGSVTNPVTITGNLKKNTAAAKFQFVMLDAVTGQPKPSLGSAVIVTRNVDSTGFAAGSLSAVTEQSGGWYSVDFAAADLNGNFIGFKATNAACRDTDMLIVTQP